MTVLVNRVDLSRRSQPGFKPPPVTPANVEARVEAPFHAHTKMDTVETLMQPRNKATTRREEVDATREQAAAPPQPLAPTLLPYTEDDLLPGARQQRAPPPSASACKKPVGPPAAATQQVDRGGAYDDEDGDEFEGDYMNVDTRRSPGHSLERLDEANSSGRPLVSGARSAGPAHSPNPPQRRPANREAARKRGSTLIPLSDMPADSEYVNTLVERPPPERTFPTGRAICCEHRRESEFETLSPLMKWCYPLSYHFCLLVNALSSLVESFYALYLLK